jgi:hypothetical protein
MMRMKWFAEEMNEGNFFATMKLMKEFINESNRITYHSAYLPNFNRRRGQ